MTREIPLTQGKVAVIDEADWPLVMDYKWHAARGYKGVIWYARAWRGKGQNRHPCAMHRMIMNAPQGVLVDHRDGDGLNNTRDNLRLATKQQNNMNRRPRGVFRANFKGVSPSRFGTFEAGIRRDGKRVHLGTYPTQEQAANAYDVAARQAFGEFAALNLDAHESVVMRRKNNKSGYRGVSFENRSTTKYVANIYLNGRMVRLGLFSDPIEAAKAYDEAAIAHWGSSAKLNFPR